MDDVEPLSLPEDLEPHALVTSLELQASDLLVSATWIRKHTPGIHYLEVSSLKLYDSAKRSSAPPRSPCLRMRCRAELDSGAALELITGERRVGTRRRGACTRVMRWPLLRRCSLETQHD